MHMYAHSKRRFCKVLSIFRKHIASDISYATKKDAAKRLFVFVSLSRTDPPDRASHKEVSLMFVKDLMSSYNHFRQAGRSRERRHCLHECGVVRYDAVCDAQSHLLGVITDRE